VSETGSFRISEKVRPRKIIPETVLAFEENKTHLEKENLRLPEVQRPVFGLEQFGIIHGELRK
jgi:hypothetical protein